jgi:O-methyltransferase involved in polyketide biosynthesis
MIPKPEEIADCLIPQLTLASDTLLRFLATQGAISSVIDRMIAGITFSARKYDDYTQNFTAEHKDGCVVNLGCGLDTRFRRVATSCNFLISIFRK